MKNYPFHNVGAEFVEITALADGEQLKISVNKEDSFKEVHIYDGNDNLISQLVPNGHTGDTIFTFDKAGDTIRAKTFSGGSAKVLQGFFLAKKGTGSGAGVGTGATIPINATNNTSIEQTIINEGQTRASRDGNLQLQITNEVQDRIVAVGEVQSEVNTLKTRADTSDGRDDGQDIAIQVLTTRTQTPASLTAVKNFDTSSPANPPITTTPTQISFAPEITKLRGTGISIQPNITIVRLEHSNTTASAMLRINMSVFGIMQNATTTNVSCMVKESINGTDYVGAILIDERTLPFRASAPNERDGKIYMFDYEMPPAAEVLTNKSKTAKVVPSVKYLYFEYFADNSSVLLAQKTALTITTEGLVGAGGGGAKMFAELANDTQVVGANGKEVINNIDNKISENTTKIEELDTRLTNVEAITGAGSFTIETLNTTAPATGITNGFNNQTARFKPHPSLFGGQYLILAGSTFNAYDPNINDGNFVNFSSTLPAPSNFNIYQYWTDASGILCILGKPSGNTPYLPTEIKSWDGSAWVSKWNNGNGGNYPNGAVAIKEDGSYLVLSQNSDNQACVWTMGADFSNPVAYPLSGVSASSLTNAGIWEVGAFIVVKAGTALFRVNPADNYSTTAITLPTNFTIPQGGLCSHDGFLWSGNTNTTSNSIYAYDPVANSFTKYVLFDDFMCQCIYFDEYKQTMVALKHLTSERTQSYAVGTKNTTTNLWEFDVKFEATAGGLDIIGSPVIDTGSGYITLQITGKSSVRRVR